MKYFPLLFLVLLAGCVSIPKETVSLSGEIQTMIASAKTAHFNLLDEYERQRRARIDDYMQAVYIPRFIKNMAKQGDLWGKTCKIANTIDAAVELQGFVEAAARLIAAKRKELTDELDISMAELRAAVREHYAIMEQSNQVVTRNLRSVRANDELVGNILKKNGVDTEKITPLKEVSAKLDKLFE